jgi:DNA-binding NtrC family response regulator
VSANPFDDLDEGQTALSPAAPRRAGRGFALVVVSGPDAGARLDLGGGEAQPALIGTSSSCALRLTDREVSRRHASAEIAGAELRLTDVGSTNGTRVGPLRIESALLVGGELVHVGSTVIRVERIDPGTVDVPDAIGFGPLLGASLAMRRLYPTLERLARAAVPVIVEGETGTGKEVAAEALHEASPRRGGPFVVFDCTTVAPNLVESELFGHEKGAFTGATSARRGVFEQAHGGTLLIDEIGDLDLALQPKLLRCIERSEIRRVGGDQPIRVDVRVIAATRRDLDRAVQEGRFRDDLFHRLAIGRVELPPLRKRTGDIARLASHFWKVLGGADPQALAEALPRWEGDPWPGNVRELRNAVARLIALGEVAAHSDSEARKTPAPDAGDFIDAVVASQPPLPVGRLRVVEEYERRYIARVLEQHGGNVARAAAASGIARRYFQILKRGRR